DGARDDEERQQRGCYKGRSSGSTLGRHRCSSMDPTFDRGNPADADLLGVDRWRKRNLTGDVVDLDRLRSRPYTAKVPWWRNGDGGRNSKERGRGGMARGHGGHGRALAGLDRAG